MTARNDTAGNEAASASENTVEEDDEIVGLQQERKEISLESTTDHPSVNGSQSRSTLTVGDVGHFQKITFPTPSPTILVGFISLT